VASHRPSAAARIASTSNEARQAKVLTQHEARRIAINITRLPGLLGRANVRIEFPWPTVTFQRQKRERKSRPSAKNAWAFV
jgi:hypothetical protein